jgi:hypothetical protein
MRCLSMLQRQKQQTSPPCLAYYCRSSMTNTIGTNFIVFDHKNDLLISYSLSIPSTEVSTVLC